MLALKKNNKKNNNNKTKTGGKGTEARREK